MYKIKKLLLILIINIYNEFMLFYKHAEIINEVIDLWTLSQFYLFESILKILWMFVYFVKEVLFTLI